MLTPVERRGDYWFKRDDLYEYAGCNGGKVRTARVLCEGATGLVTAGSRHSPQIVIISHIAELMGVPFRAHTASGALSEELKGLASMKMTEIVQHKPGYNSVIKHRARTDAKERNWTYIPFGMECQEAVIQTAAQVENIPDGVKRLVMPIGSGMSFCGVATGLMRFGKSIPLFGVRVGADYHRVFDRYFPPNFGPSLFSKGTVKTIMMSPHAYSKRVHAEVEGILLDPVYEAKCAQYLQKDDLLWIVGIR